MNNTLRIAVLAAMTTFIVATFPKGSAAERSACASNCSDKATDAWSRKAAECENLSGKEQKRCFHDADTILDRTLKQCLRNCRGG